MHGKGGGEVGLLVFAGMAGHDQPGGDHQHQPGAGQHHGNGQNQRPDDMIRKRLRIDLPMQGAGNCGGHCTRSPYTTVLWFAH